MVTRLGVVRQSGADMLLAGDDDVGPARGVDDIIIVRVHDRVNELAKILVHADLECAALVGGLARVGADRDDGIVRNADRRMGPRPGEAEGPR